MGEFSKGRTKTFWYSDSKPQGTGREGVSYDKHMYDTFSNVLYNINSVSNQDVIKAQEMLISIGYLDPHYFNASANRLMSSADGFVGGRTHGAMKRYLNNFAADSNRAAFGHMLGGAFDATANVFTLGGYGKAMDKIEADKKAAHKAPLDKQLSDMELHFERMKNDSIYRKKWLKK